MFLMSRTHVLDQEMTIQIPTLETQRYSDAGGWHKDSGAETKE